MKASTVCTKPVYIFLDFDGVLHADGPEVLADPKRPKHRGEYRFAFHQSGLVEWTLKRHAPNARIIVSSAWRTIFETVDDLRFELLGAGCDGGLVNRMVGMTPVFNEDDEHVDPTVGIRLQEILAYIKTHDLGDVPCLIIDDNYLLFKGKRGLFFPTVVPDAETGFSFKDAEETVGWLTQATEALKPEYWFWPLKNNSQQIDEPEPEIAAA